MELDPWVALFVDNSAVTQALTGGAKCRVEEKKFNHWKPEEVSTLNGGFICVLCALLIMRRVTRVFTRWASLTEFLLL